MTRTNTDLLDELGEILDQPRHVDRRRADQARRDEYDDRLIFWGYLMAILVWPIGFVLGIILVTRQRVGHGIGVMSLAMFLLFLVVAITSG
jgi:cobalamin biosynthesis protein CobD/CbiB